MLDELDRAANVSQRMLADRLHMAVGMVNRHIHRLLDEGHIQVVNPAVRPFAYRLTEKGRAYRRRLSHEQYHTVLGNLRVVKGRIEARLSQIRAGGAERVVFYGAGEVMELAYPIAKKMGLTVAGIVDDDPRKWGKKKNGLRIEPPESVASLAPHALVITTIAHGTEIRGRLEGEGGPPLPVFEL